MNQIEKSEPYNGIDTYIVPINILKPGEDLGVRETPSEIDDYPIVIYGDGEIQDGHHRYKYMLENNYKNVRVIIATDLDEDWDLFEDEWNQDLLNAYNLF